MISLSVRDALHVAGQSASLRQLAQQAGKTFPLSLRWWLGAPPPGRILRKVWSLDLLQRKFDEFINDPTPPLFQIRLHGEHYGSSDLEIKKKDPVDRSKLEVFYTKHFDGLEMPLTGLRNPD